MYSKINNNSKYNKNNSISDSLVLKIFQTLNDNKFVFIQHNLHINPINTFKIIHL